MAVGCQPLFYCQLVVGTQDTHIEGGAVACQSALPHPCLVEFHKHAVHHVERQVNTLAEVREAVKHRTVSLG